MDSRFGHFSELILKIRKLIVKIKDVEMERLGLKGIHLTCLLYINKMSDKNSDVTATDISKASGEDKAAISRVLNELEKSGLIVQHNGDKKKYRASLILTKSGEEIMEKINEKLAVYENLASANLTDEERKGLYVSLESIHDNLEKLIDKM